MDEAAVDPEGNEEIQEMPDDSAPPKSRKKVEGFSDLSVEELHEELDRAIKHENYERASILRDELDRRGEK
jgi:hypothetical protein